MAKRGEQILEEVRPSSGRSSWLDDNCRIAGVLKQSNNYLLVDELGSNFIPIPFKELSREGTFSLPTSSSFNFLGKDLTTKIKSNWNRRPMADENLSIERRMARALGVYDWVLKEKPDAIVVWTDVYPEMRAAVMAGNDLNIPTFEIVHGGFHPLMHGHFETKRYAKYSLGSWEFRRWHQFYGCGSEVVPTGSTQMDVWARANLDVLRAKARHAMEIPPFGVVVCYLEDAAFERNPLSDQGVVDNQLLEFLNTFKLLETLVADPYLVLKMHPYDKQNTPHSRKDQLKEMGIKNYTIIDDNLPMALAASDITVGNRSTAMVEGFMLGIPAVITASEPYFEAEWYEGMGFEIVRSNDNLLSKLVGVLADSEKMIDLINATDRGARYFGSDGLASLRAIRVIDKVLKGESVGEADYGTLPD